MTTARLWPVLELPPRAIAAWSDLAARAIEPNPFSEPEFLVPNARRAWRDEPMMVVLVESGSDLVGAVPFFQTRVGRWFRGWSSQAGGGVPLLDRTCADEAFAAAVAMLSRRPGLTRVLMIDRIPADGPVAEAVRSGLGARRAHWRPSDPPTRPFVRRRSTASHLDETFKGRRRADIQRKRRRLDALLGQPARLVDHGGDPVAVDRFLTLEAAGWKGRGGWALLCRPSGGPYFREMCAGFAADGRMHILALQAGDVTVAMRCEIEAGNGRFEVRSAYDERYKRFSPGVQLEVDAINSFHDSGLSFMSCGTNHPQHPAFWLYPDGRPLADLVAPLGGHVSLKVLNARFNRVEAGSRSGP